MTDKSEPIMDWSKSIMNVDLTKLNEEFTTMMAQMNVPGINMDELMATQKANLEALAIANKAAVEAFQEVGKLQIRLLKNSMGDVSSIVKTLGEARSPQEVATKQAQLAGEAFKTVFTNMQEIADIMTEANKTASNALSKRFSASLNEVQDILKTK
jgi:phasin family protein